ncbi:MAG: hypothetical protein ACE5JA_06365 [bacterium]
MTSQRWHPDGNPWSFSHAGGHRLFCLPVSHDSAAAPITTRYAVKFTTGSPYPGIAEKPNLSVKGSRFYFSAGSPVPSRGSAYISLDPDRTSRLGPGVCNCPGESVRVPVRREIGPGQYRLWWEAGCDRGDRDEIEPRGGDIVRCTCTGSR